MSEYLTDREVAAELGIGWKQVQIRCYAAEWPHLRIGRLYRFTPAHLAQIVELCTVKVKLQEAPENPWGFKDRSSPRSA